MASLGRGTSHRIHSTQTVKVGEGFETKKI